MITITDFTVNYDPERNAYKITSKDVLCCPLCGGPMSGYDTRRRHVVDGAGNTYWLLLQRLRCSSCNKLHVIAPAFIVPRKHYEASVIADVKAGRVDLCPADNSTIRRWRR